ncbi:MAG: MFS transporter [Proteobacteria bacterium]|nr:MFS transporter [Pseudomonadota bacterium]
MNVAMNQTASSFMLHTHQSEKPSNALNRNSVLFIVFLVAFSLIYLELILYHALEFVASYLEATMAIPIALLGISIGAIVTFLLKNTSSITLEYLNKVFVLFIISFPIIFFSIAHFSSNIFSFPYLLLLPFIFGSMILSMFFIYSSSSKVYFADLIGAGFGAIASAVSIEYLGIETGLFAGCAVVSLSWLAFNIVATWKRSAPLTIFVLLSIASTGVVGYQMITDNLNLAKISRIQKNGTSEGRVYAYLKNKKKDKRKLIYSHSSTSGRTDAVAVLKNKGGIQKLKVYHNGQLSDSFKFKEVPGYSLDPRVPWGFIEDPSTLIIGTSAEGVVSAVAGMGDGKIHGVEICTGKVELMTDNIGKEVSNDAYQYLDHLEVIDGRTFLNINDYKYDHITLMNSHLGQRFLRQSAPEYLHTVDAIMVYFDHLTERGFINIEEVSNREKIDDDINIKLTATIIEALKQAGVAEPGKHLFVYRWGDYIQWFIKKIPFTNQQLEWLNKWLEEQVTNTEPRPFIVTPSIVWHPQKTINGPIAYLIRNGGNVKKPGRNYSPATDDNPFGFDVIKGRPTVTRVASIVVFMTVILVLVPVVLIMFLQLRMKLLQGISMFLYFGLLGIAYLLIEIMLIQKYQMYIGSPIGSAVAILGGMLIFSGLGSYASDHFGYGKHRIKIVFVLIGTFAISMVFGLPHFFEIFATTSIWLRMLASVLSIAPLAFFMGMPFPIALSAAKRHSDKRTAALMFSVNGAFSAIATPISCIISMNFGFQITLVTGISIYFILLLLLQSFDR